MSSMKWVGISGGWKVMTPAIEETVRRMVRRILDEGNGIVAGGALGVDFFALDEALKRDPGGKRIKIFLPTALDIYADYNRNMVELGQMTSQQAEALIDQLTKLKQSCPMSLIENPNMEVTKETFFERNSSIVDASDSLVAFHIISEASRGPGTVDTIEKAREKRIPVETLVFDFTEKGELAKHAR